jgi:phosphatidylinositol glycan class B
VNYVEINIIQDVASGFGTTNWYIYIIKVIFASVVPIGVLIFIAYIVLLVDSPKSLVIWIVTPLLLVHFIIPHKETRFLFPLANFAPLVLMMGCQQAVALFRDPSSYRRAAVVAGWCLAIINLAALLPSIVSAPANGRMAITKYIRDDFSRRPVKVYSLQAEEENPFQPYSFLRQSFYELPNVQCYTIPDYRALSTSMFVADTLGFLVIHQGELANPDLSAKIKQLGLVRVKGGVPTWALALEGFYDQTALDAAYALYARGGMNPYYFSN